MRIGIIGAGKAGVTLGKYLSCAGVDVSGFYSRTEKSADEAATFTGTGNYHSIAELAAASDTIFITTPDGAIQSAWRELASCNIRGYLVCHFSGSLSSHVFTGIEKTGASGISIHPMFAFSDKFSSYQQFHTACLTMEGDASAVKLMKPFWEGLGHKVLLFADQENIVRDKLRYHAAAAMASNMVLGLVQTSIALLEGCGFDEWEAVSLLAPLVRGNVDTMLEEGCVAALTGPVERGDAETVGKHLEALAGTQAEGIYRSLGDVMVAMAQEKHPEKDFSKVQEALKRRRSLID